MKESKQIKRQRLIIASIILVILILIFFFGRMAIIRVISNQQKYSGTDTITLTASEKQAIVDSISDELPGLIAKYLMGSESGDIGDYSIDEKSIENLKTAVSNDILSTLDTINMLQLTDEQLDALMAEIQSKIVANLTNDATISEYLTHDDMKLISTEIAADATVGTGKELYDLRLQATTAATNITNLKTDYNANKTVINNSISSMQSDLDNLKSQQGSANSSLKTTVENLTSAYNAYKGTTDASITEIRNALGTKLTSQEFNSFMNSYSSDLSDIISSLTTLQKNMSNADSSLQAQINALVGDSNQSLSDLQAYIDSEIANTKTITKEYADAATSAAESNANAYTDTKISNLSTTLNDLSETVNNSVNNSISTIQNQITEQIGDYKFMVENGSHSGTDGKTIYFVIK